MKKKSFDIIKNDYLNGNIQIVPVNFLLCELFEIQFHNDENIDDMLSFSNISFESQGYSFSSVQSVVLYKTL
jgi:hypothetical protein